MISVAIAGTALAALAGVAISAQDKYSLQVPKGVALAEFKGYETWELVSVSHPVAGEGGTETLNVILGNPAMNEAYARRHSRPTASLFPTARSWRRSSTT